MNPQPDKEAAKKAYRKKYYKDHFKEKMAYLAMRNKRIKEGTWWKLECKEDKC